jgi:thioredoxin reductase (NADPH)
MISDNGKDQGQEHEREGDQGLDQEHGRERVVIIGAGPCGLAAAIELTAAGVDPLLIERGAIAHSIFDYPTYMIFHSTPELLEIGGIPFTTPNEKPTRLEALNYYRLAAVRNRLRIRTYETVTKVVRREADGAFTVTTENRFGEPTQLTADCVVVATGYFDHPNKLGIPGEHLPKVFSYYKEAHPYADLQVAIAGGNNSAIDAALDLERSGALVTVVYRGAELSSKVKAWTRPMFLSKVDKGRIRMLYQSRIVEIMPHAIRVDTPAGHVELPNDFVFTLIGYRPDRTLLRELGVAFAGPNGAPHIDLATMETNVPGVYLAGVVSAGGNEANSIFIENGRFHGKLIAEHIAARFKHNPKH